MKLRPGGGLGEVSSIHGDRLEELIAEAKEQIASVTADAGDALGRKEAVRLIAQIGDPVAREQLIQALSDNASVKKSLISDGVNAERSRQRKQNEAQRNEVKATSLMHAAVDPTTMFSGIVELFDRHAYLPAGAAQVLAMWAINTWTFSAFRTVPYLSLESATKGCGKTTVLELLESVCATPFRATSLTAAVVFRIIERDHPTLLIDEAEVLFGYSEASKQIRAIAHAGYKQGGSVPRVVGEGAHADIQEYDVFCPKAFATIGGLKGALQDRCIVVRLEKAPRSCGVVPVRENRLAAAARPLRADLEAYAAQVKDRLITIYESEPAEGHWPELRNREAEIWTPLLTNARLIGPELEQQMRRIALTFSGYKQKAQSEERDLAMGRELLDVLLTFVNGNKFLPSGLVQHLKALPTWGAELEPVSDKTAAMRVARFVQKYGELPMHERGGSAYAVSSLIDKLQAHLPENEAAVEDHVFDVRADTSNADPLGDTHSPTTNMISPASQRSAESL